PVHPFAAHFPQRWALGPLDTQPDPQTGVVPQAREAFETAARAGDEGMEAVVAGLTLGSELAVSLFRGLVERDMPARRALAILSNPDTLQEMVVLAANPALVADPVRLDIDWETPTRELLAQIHARLSKKGRPFVISRTLFHTKEVNYPEFIDREKPPDAPMHCFLRLLPKNAGSIAYSTDVSDLQAFAGVRELAVFLERVLSSPTGLWPAMNIVALRSRMRKSKTVVCADVKSDGVYFRTVHLDPLLTNWFVLRREEVVGTSQA